MAITLRRSSSTKKNTSSSSIPASSGRATSTSNVAGFTSASGATGTAPVYSRTTAQPQTSSQANFSPVSPGNVQASVPASPAPLRVDTRGTVVRPSTAPTVVSQRTSRSGGSGASSSRNGNGGSSRTETTTAAAQQQKTAASRPRTEAERATAAIVQAQRTLQRIRAIEARRSAMEEYELVKSGVMPSEQASPRAQMMYYEARAEEEALVRYGVASAFRQRPPEPQAPPSRTFSFIGPLYVGSPEAQERVARAGDVIVRVSKGPESAVGRVASIPVRPALGLTRTFGEFLQGYREEPGAQSVKSVAVPAAVVAFPQAALAYPVFTGFGKGFRTSLEITRGEDETISTASPEYLTRLRESGVEASSRLRLPLPGGRSINLDPLGRRQDFESFVRPRVGGNEAVVQRLVRERRYALGGQVVSAIGAEVVGEATGQGLISGTVLRAGGRIRLSGTREFVYKEAREIGGEALFPAGVAEATAGYAGGYSLSTGENAPIERTAAAAAFGGFTAQTVGGTIIAKQAVGEKSRLGFYVNIVEPVEPVGDVLFGAIQRGRRRAGAVTFDTGVRTVPGGAEFVSTPTVSPGSVVEGFVSDDFTSPGPGSRRPPSRDVSLVPESQEIVLSPARTAVPASVQRSRLPVGSIAPSPVPINLPSVLQEPSSSFFPSSSPQKQISPVITPVKTPTRTTTPVLSTVFTPVKTFTPPIPGLGQLPEGRVTDFDEQGIGERQGSDFLPDFTAAFFGQRAGKKARRVGGSFAFGGFERRLLG